MKRHPRGTEWRFAECSIVVRGGPPHREQGTVSFTRFVRQSLQRNFNGNGQDKQDGKANKDCHRVFENLLRKKLLSDTGVAGERSHSVLADEIDVDN